MIPKNLEFTFMEMNYEKTFFKDSQYLQIYM